MSKKKTNEEFIREIHGLVGNEYSFIDIYKDAKTKLKIIHNKCSQTYEVTPNNFLKGKRCPHCYGNKKKTHSQFVKELYGKVGDKFTVVGEYVNVNTPIKVKHNKCSNEYLARPNHLLSGTGCPFCYGNAKKKHNEFLEEVYLLVGNEYTVMSKYKSANGEIKMRHNECGYEYKTKPGNFLTGKRCWKCSGSAPLSNEDFLERISYLVGDEYVPLSEYNTSIKKVKMKHVACGHEYDVTPNAFLRGTRCPYCNISKGEEAIKNYLIENGINFIREYFNEECVNKRALRFDFAIYEEDESNIVALIEFDGEQHFKPIKHFGGMEKLKEQRINDEIKNNFAKKKSIPLIRIPYYQYKNISDILANQLA